MIPTKITQMPFRYTVSALLCACIVVWCGVAWYFSPPHFTYRVAFFAVAALVALITYRTPAKGWWLFVALIPVASIPSRVLQLGAHDAVTFLGILCVLSWAISTCVAARPFPSYRPAFVPLFLVIALSITSILWTLARYADISYFITGRFESAWVNRDGVHASFALRHVVLSGLRSVLMPLVFIMGYAVSRPHTPETTYVTQALPTERLYTRLAVVWFFALLPALCIALYQANFDASFALLGSHSWQEELRVSGGMTDPNALGLFLFLAVPIGITAIFYTQGFIRIILAWCALLSLYIAMLTGSRSLLLGFFILTIVSLICAFFYACLQPSSRRSAFLAVGAAGVALCIFLAPFLLHIAVSSTQTPTLARFASFVERTRVSPQTDLVDKRSLQWQQAFTMWREFPVSGVGVGAFAIELPNYNIEAAQETPVDNAWNQYFHWLAETGASGLVMWLWFILACAVGITYGVYRVWRARDPARPYALVMAGTMGVFLILCVFGAHLDAPEVASAAGVVSAMLYARLPHTSRGRLRRADMCMALLVVLIICISQGRNATHALSRATRAERFRLPRHFGIYAYETWGDAFVYHWTKPYAGWLIHIPEEMHLRVLRMHLAGINPAISPAEPRTVRVRINGILLREIVLTDPAWHYHDVLVYDGQPGKALLTLEAHPAWYPAHEIPPRALGIAVDTGMTWRTLPSWESQGFSDWHEETRDEVTRTYRWMHKDAASVLPASDTRTYRIAVRAPRPLRRYATPPVFTLSTSDRELLSVFLAPDGTWTEHTFTLPVGTHGRDVLLFYHVSETDTVRMPGSTRRVERGVAVSRIEPL